MSHWSHDARYPHRINLPQHGGHKLVDAVSWCEQQWGPSDKRVFHKPGRMGLTLTGRRNGWYYFQDQFHFARPEQAIMCKLACA